MLNRLFLIVLIASISLSGCGKKTKTASTPPVPYTASGDLASKLVFNGFDYTIEIHKKAASPNSSYLEIARSILNPHEFNIRLLDIESRSWAEKKLSLKSSGKFPLLFEPLFKTGRKAMLTTGDIIPNFQWECVKPNKGFIYIDVDSDGTLETRFDIDLDNDGTMHFLSKTAILSLPDISSIFNPAAGAKFPSKIDELIIEDNKGAITIRKKEEKSKYPCLILSKNKSNALMIDVACENKHHCKASTAIRLDGTHINFFNTTPLFNSDDNSCSVTSSMDPIHGTNVYWHSDAVGQGILKVDTDLDGSLETEFAIQLNTEGEISLNSTDKLKKQNWPSALENISLEQYTISDAHEGETWVAVRKNCESPEIIWHINGNRGKAKTQHESNMTAKWSEKLGRIVVLSINGVSLINPEDCSVEFVWKKEFLKMRYAFSPESDKIFVCGFDFDAKKKFVAAMDLNTRQNLSFYVDSTPSEMFFTDTNSAKAIFENTIIEALFDTNEWTLSEKTKPKYKPKRKEVDSF